MGVSAKAQIQTAVHAYSSFTAFDRRFPELWQKKRQKFKIKILMENIPLCY